MMEIADMQPGSSWRSISGAHQLIILYPDPIIRFKADDFPTKQSVNLLVKIVETLSI